MTATKTCLAAALVVLTGHAHALNWSLTSGTAPSFASALVERFDPLDGLDLVRTGGVLFDTSVDGVAARPPGSDGHYWGVGGGYAEGGTGVISLSGPVGYYGFLWGSPDWYNSVEFWNGDTLLASLGGSDVFNPANGFQGAVQGGQYFNAFVGHGEAITRVVFRSLGNSFETDNHAVAAIPEPETYALMLAGLAVVGLAARRRRKS